MKKLLLVLIAGACILLGTCSIAHAEEETPEYTCANVPGEIVEGNIIISETGNESGECTIEHSIYATGSIYIDVDAPITLEGETTSGSGSITLDGTDVATDEISAKGSFEVEASGDVELFEKVSAANSVFIKSDGKIEIQGEVEAADEVNIQADGELLTEKGLTTTSGAVKLDADGGSLKVEENITSGSGIETESTSDSEFKGKIQAAGDVSIKADNSVDLDKNLTTTAGFVKLEAKDGTLKVEEKITSSSYIESESTDNTEIKGEVHAAGKVSIKSKDSIVLKKDLTTTEDFVDLVAEGGTLKVEGNITTDGGIVVLRSQEDMSLENIEASGSEAYGVRIFANEGHSGSEEFKIGSAGATNGVGHIYADSTSASYGADIYITNGGSAGIAYSGTEQLQVNNSGGQPGAIFLDSRTAVGSTGPITLSGSLNVSASGDYTSGSITIMAPEIKVEGSTGLFSDDSSTASATNKGHFINFATAVLKLDANLEIQVKGVGDAPGYDVFTGTPVGSIAVTAHTDPEEGISEITYPNSSESLTTEGSGKLSVYTEGKKNTAGLWGNPLKLGKTYFDANGNGDEVSINSESGWTSPVLNKLTFEGEVEVYANAEESSATPGKIVVSGSEIAKPDAHVELDTAGVDGGTGGTDRVVSEKGEVYLGGSGDNITLNVSAFAGDGSAGTAKVEAGKSTVKIAENAFYASSFEGNSSGGTVEVHGGKVESTKANLALFATGHGSGKGGTLDLESEGKLSIGPNTGEFELVVVAQETGGAGKIELAGSEVQLNGGYIFDTPETSGDGAEIKVYNTGTLKISKAFPLEANGKDDGDGGTLDFEADKIEFENEEATINAKGAGTGSGGVITMDVSDADPVILGEDITISVVSGENEENEEDERNTVTINHAAGSDDEPVDLEDIEIDPSPSYKLKAGDFKALNGITCHVWTTGYVFPALLWNCTSHDPPEAFEEAPFNVDHKLEGPILHQLGTTPYRIYIVENYLAWELMEDKAITNIEDDGITFSDRYLGTQGVASAVFREFWNSKTIKFEPLTEAQAKYIAAHESGHAMDFKGTPENQSYANNQNELAETIYGKYVQNDFFYLDFSKVGTELKNSTPRYPCEPTVAGGKSIPGPFEGVYDSVNKEEFCGSGSGYYVPAGHTVGIESEFVEGTTLWRNSRILQYVSKYIMTQSGGSAEFSYPGGWAELYAEAFDYEAYLAPEGIKASESGQPIANSEFEKQYFLCTRAWAKAVYKQETVPPSTPPTLLTPLSGKCTTAVPNWYAGVLGK